MEIGNRIPAYGQRVARPDGPGSPSHMSSFLDVLSEPITLGGRPGRNRRQNRGIVARRMQGSPRDNLILACPHAYAFVSWRLVMAVFPEQEFAAGTALQRDSSPGGLVVVQLSCLE